MQSYLRPDSNSSAQRTAAGWSTCGRIFQSAAGHTVAAPLFSGSVNNSIVKQHLTKFFFFFFNQGVQLQLLKFKCVCYSRYCLLWKMNACREEDSVTPFLFGSLTVVWKHRGDDFLPLIQRTYARSLTLARPLTPHVLPHS